MDQTIDLRQLAGRTLTLIASHQRCAKGRQTPRYGPQKTLGAGHQPGNFGEGLDLQPRRRHRALISEASQPRMSVLGTKRKSADRVTRSGSGRKADIRLQCRLMNPTDISGTPPGALSPQDQPKPGGLLTKCYTLGLRAL